MTITAEETTTAAAPQDELEEQANELLANFTARLTTSAEQYVEQLSRARSAPATATDGQVRLGEPTVNDYVAFDIAALSPIQFSGFPPYQPSKIIAAGEDAFLFVFMFTNPLVSIPDGFAIPASVQLSGRNWRIRLEQVNLSQVQNGPDGTRTGTFGPPAAIITSRFFRLPTPDPGPNPRIMEALITADIDNPALPFAAFASNIFDIDPDPAFFGIPPSPPQWTHNVPLRYIVYRK
jgi:hypothetical protein